MTRTPHISALIVAAGSGQRVGGGVPKQYRPIHGKPMLRYSAEALLAHPAVREVRVVIDAGHRALYDAAMAGLALGEPITGGAQRSDSVRAGLKALEDAQPDYVCIHDAARPFLSHAMIDALVAGLKPDTAVLPALGLPDTVRRMVEGGWEPVPREGLMRMQTPQCFPFATLHALYETNANATDDAALWLAAGHELAYVAGDERLRKVTTADDIRWAESALPRTPRTAMGYDVHKLVPHASGEAKVIRLGGLAIDHDFKLEGHSDADVVLHAITDALLGTIAREDIGAHFPPSDPKWKGADSSAFLRHAASLVTQAGGEITHIDATILCEAPKIAPHRDAMRAHIAGLLGLGIANVSIKATTTEGLGFTGRREGIACQAVANVMMREA